MPLNYLQEIDRAKLPFTVTDPEGIKQIELLRAALVITATIQRTTPDAKPISAVVHQITAAGLLLLRRNAV